MKPKRVYFVTVYEDYFLSAHSTRKLAEATAKKWRQKMGRGVIGIYAMVIDAPDKTTQTPEGGDE